MPKRSVEKRAARRAREASDRFCQTKLNFPKLPVKPKRERTRNNRRGGGAPTSRSRPQLSSAYEEDEYDVQMAVRQQEAEEEKELAEIHTMIYAAEQCERRAKRPRIERAGESGASAVFESASTLRVYEEDDTTEEGEVEDDPWDREVQTGEIPPFPVRRPYYLGGMGRYGIEIPIHGFIPINSEHEPELQAEVESVAEAEAQPDPEPASVERQYWRVSFGGDELFQLDDDDHEQEGEGEYEEEVPEEDIDMDDEICSRASTPPTSPHCEQAVSRPSRWDTRSSQPFDPIEPYCSDQSNLPGKDWIWTFGKYKNQRFDETLFDVCYLKSLGGDAIYLTKYPGLRPAFEYYYPEYLTKKALRILAAGSTKRPPARPANALAASSTNRAAADAANAPAAGSATNANLTSGAWLWRIGKDYVFDFGQHAGKRFDATPDNYLKQLAGQVASGRMQNRKGLREAFEWHLWGGKQRAQARLERFGTG